MIFVLFFVIAFVYYRLRVLVTGGKIPFIREVTGLTIHHFHIGSLFVLIASLMLIFWRVGGLSVGLIGFGLGAVMDSFVSRLFNFGSVRAQEIAVYNYSFGLSVLLFADIVLSSFVFYFWRE